MSDIYLNNIFEMQHSDFDKAALSLFSLQYNDNPVYQQWVNALHREGNMCPSTLNKIPFLPISFFKSHTVVTGNNKPSAIFESSGTTGMQSSKHYVADVELYRQSFRKGFQHFYGAIQDYCVLGLLPSYLERSGSSLVMMVDDWIRESNHPQSGFYLNNLADLQQVLQTLVAAKQPTILIGVTFGLLDFAEQFAMPLGKHCIVMETGGMKGRRKEMTRLEVHQVLKQAFDITAVHSEYGMTELLAQAYSRGDGRFVCPPWMKVMLRSTDDPLHVDAFGKGALNIVDLSNQHSCAFIATDDIGIVYEDGSFEVQGRLDNCDVRGCNLLVV